MSFWRIKSCESYDGSFLNKKIIWHIFVHIFWSGLTMKTRTNSWLFENFLTNSPFLEREGLPYLLWKLNRQYRLTHFWAWPHPDMTSITLTAVSPGLNPDFIASNFGLEMILLNWPNAHLLICSIWLFQRGPPYLHLWCSGTTWSSYHPKTEKT